MNNLVLTPLPGVPLIVSDDDLPALTLVALDQAGLDLQNDDVLVYTSKIISKAAGRWRDLRDVTPSPAAAAISRSCNKDSRLVELILSESNQILRLRPGLIIAEHKSGFVCANAGIDHSNAGGDENIVLLLPLDADASARGIRQALQQATGVYVAIIINDSHGRAWRIGTVGIAIGIAGIDPLSDRRGDDDIFGRTLEVTVLGTADELAAAASLAQGGADERSPIIHIRGARFHKGEGELASILRPLEMDLFR